VLDMGEPVKIVDLARQMIRLAGLEPERDIKIVFTGLRTGEKLSERLSDDDEPLQRTALPGILTASPRIVPRQAIDAFLDRLAEAAREGAETAELTALLAQARRNGIEEDSLAELPRRKRPV
jgi:O-antigen biosynthesis protein WbqV